MVIKQGEQMLASDILDMTFFPIGSILMMDGNWENGRGGWYICDWRVIPYGNTPNLTNKFIRGNNSSGSTGGADLQSITLTTSHLPKHTHSQSGHSHNLRDLNNNNLSSRGISWWGPGSIGGISGGVNVKITGEAVNIGSNLAHLSGTTSSVSPAINNAGLGQPFMVATVPYYPLIYIKKMV